jgi:heme-degrading monooxygenase HmoA
MVTEFVTFRLEPGSGPGFEQAFVGVACLLTGADGHLRHRLVPMLDDPNSFLLQVEWRDLAAHIEGFEPSEAHEQFITALVPFLVEEPTVVHIPTDPQTDSIVSCCPRWMNG